MTEIRSVRYHQERYGWDMQERDHMNTMKHTVALAVLILSIAACIAVWPVGMIHNTETSQPGNEYNHLTESLTEGIYAVQEFIPQHDYLEKLAIIVDKNAMTSDAGFLQLTVYDTNQTTLYAEQIPISELHSYQDYVAEVHLELSPGQHYFYSLQAFDTEGEGPRMVYRSMSRVGAPEEISLSYFGSAQLPDAAAMVRFIYRTGLTWYQIILYDAFILCIGCLLIGVINGKNSGIVFTK